jgi:hypothetical protein
MNKSTIKATLWLLIIATLVITSFTTSDVIISKLFIALGIIACVYTIKKLPANLIGI